MGSPVLGRVPGEEPERCRMDEQLTLEPELEPERDERAKVESWRLHVLIVAGYPLPLAERLAQSSSDLHEAVQLVTVRGCTPQVAAQILL
jgi:hypothetical protein